MRATSFCLGLLSLLLVSPGMSSPPPIDAALDRYMDCLSSSSLKLGEVQKRPVAPPYRPVFVDEVVRMVSVTAGYSSTVSTVEGVPVLNMKLEQSDPAVADRDRDIVRSQMRAMSNRRPVDAPAILEQKIGGVEILALHESDVRRPIASFYSLFVEKTSAVATIYVLGVRHDQADYLTPAEFAKSRDEIVRKVCACLE